MRSSTAESPLSISKVPSHPLGNSAPICVPSSRSTRTECVSWRASNPVTYVRSTRPDGPAIDQLRVSTNGKISKRHVEISLRRLPARQRLNRHHNGLTTFNVHNKFLVDRLVLNLCVRLNISTVGPAARVVGGVAYNAKRETTVSAPENTLSEHILQE